MAPPPGKLGVRPASAGNVSFAAELKQFPPSSLEASKHAGSEDDGDGSKSRGYHDLQSLHGDTVRARSSHRL